MSYDIEITQTTVLHFDNLEDAEKEYKKLKIEHNGDKNIMILGISNAPTKYRFVDGKVERGTYGFHGDFYKKSEF